MYRFHLAALAPGLLIASRGMVTLPTVIDDPRVDEIIDDAGAAFADVAVEAE
jgi:hypothetical protein